MTPISPIVPRATSVVIDENNMGINDQHWSVYSKNIEQLLLQRELLQKKHNQAIDDEMKEWKVALNVNRNNMHKHRVTRADKTLHSIFETIAEENSNSDDIDIENEIYAQTQKKPRFNIKDV